MDDFKIWFYIILGVVYLLVQLRKKKPEAEVPTDLPTYDPEKPVQQYEQPASRPTVAPKALTFEELLREITEGKEQKETEVVDYDDDLKEEIEQVEKVNYDYQKKDSIYQVYDDAKALAFNRASLEETMKLEDTEVKFGRFKGFEMEEKENLLEKYLADLKDPEGFKKAVVMGEILNRRF